MLFDHVSIVRNTPRDAAEALIRIDDPRPGQPRPVAVFAILAHGVGMCIEFLVDWVRAIIFALQTFSSD